MTAACTLDSFKEYLHLIDDSTCDKHIKLGRYIRFLSEFSLWEANPDRVTYEDGSAALFGVSTSSNSQRLVREVGLRISECGGFEAMQMVHYALPVEVGYELNHSWDGICGWTP